MKLRVRLFDPEAGVYKFEDVIIDSVLHKTYLNNVIIITPDHDEKGSYHDAMKVYDHTIFRCEIGSDKAILKAVSVIDGNQYRIIPLFIETDDKILYSEYTYDGYHLINLDVQFKNTDDNQLNKTVEEWNKSLSVKTNEDKK